MASEKLAPQGVVLLHQAARLQGNQGTSSPPTPVRAGEGDDHFAAFAQAAEETFSTAALRSCRRKHTTAGGVQERSLRSRSQSRSQSRSLQSEPQMHA